MRIVITRSGVVTKLELWSQDSFKTMEFRTTEAVVIDDQRPDADAHRVDQRLREAVQEAGVEAAKPVRARRDAPARCTECGIWAVRDRAGAYAIYHAETCSQHESNRSD